jgi:hypothetical protein
MCDAAAQASGLLSPKVTCTSGQAPGRRSLLKIAKAKPPRTRFRGFCNSGGRGLPFTGPFSSISFFAFDGSLCENPFDFLGSMRGFLWRDAAACLAIKIDADGAPDDRVQISHPTGITPQGYFNPPLR